MKIKIKFPKLTNKDKKERWSKCNIEINDIKKQLLNIITEIYNDKSDNKNI